MVVLVKCRNGSTKTLFSLFCQGCGPACLLEWCFRASGPKKEKHRKILVLVSPTKKEKQKKNRKTRTWKIIRKLPKNCVLGSFSFFSANVFLFCGGGQNQYFSPFFPISGQRPENPVLAGGQGRNARVFCTEDCFCRTPGREDGGCNLLSGCNLGLQPFVGFFLH